MLYEVITYSMERIAPVVESMRRKYLLRSKNREEQLVRVIPELRARMRFMRLNFMDEDYGLEEKFQMIFCRNVIIYFVITSYSIHYTKLYESGLSSIRPAMIWGRRGSSRYW